MGILRLVALILISVHTIYGQIDSSTIITNDYFTSPVDHTIKLAGSFGELRSNHFHSGIDIKSTAGLEGDTIKSAASGFVSRIKMQRGSYGKAIYIDHPNGFTTVYAHMQRFSPNIEHYIRERQREAQSYEIDVYPSAERLVVTRGEYIGLLGNTGRSYGPHLHFEIRHTISETPQNPYLHGIGPSDNKSPLLYAIGAQGLDNELSSISQEVKYINEKSKGQYGPEYTFEVPAWRAGMTIQSFDLMDGSVNKNGLYHLKMYVDDTLHYEMKMDSVKWKESKYINSFIEYADKKKDNRTMIRCYKQRANELNVYRTLRNGGFFKTYKSKARHIRFEARDFFGNLSSYNCQVLRKEVMDEQKNVSFNHKLSYNKSYDLKLGLIKVHVPRASTDNILLLDYHQTYNDEGLSFALGRKEQPLFKNLTVKIPISHIPNNKRTNTVLIYNSGKNPTSFGGTIAKDSLEVRIDKLGEFQLLIDTIPPTITPLEYTKSVNGRENYIFRLKDNFDTRGSAKDIKYDVYIDGNWTICPLKALGNLLTIPLAGLSKGNHNLKIIAIDHSGNQKDWESTFVK